jgi:hypothetical protein
VSVAWDFKDVRTEFVIALEICEVIDVTGIAMTWIEIPVKIGNNSNTGESFHASGRGFQVSILGNIEMNVTGVQAGPESDSSVVGPILCNSDTDLAVYNVSDHNFRNR